MSLDSLIQDLTAAGLEKQIAEEIAKNEKVAPVIQNWRESGLRQSDYDRKMNAGKAEIEAEKSRLAEEKTRLDADRARMNEQYLTALREREESASRAAALQAKVKTVADMYGLDAKELLGDAATPPTTPQTKPADPPSISPDIEKRIGTVEELFRNNFEFQAQMLDIMQQHAQLFPDKPLVVKELLDDSMKQRRTPLQVWDDKFGATQLKNERQAEKFREEGRAQAKAEYERRLSQGAINPLRPDVPLSPVFQSSTHKPSEFKPGDRNVSAAERIQRAAQALESRKYATVPAGREQ